MPQDSSSPNRAEQRTRLLEERDARLVGYLKANTSMGTICDREGMEYDYCRKECLKLAKKFNIAYKPGPTNPEPYGFTDESERFRSRLSDLIYGYLNHHHPLEVARDMGLTQNEQRQAKERPFRHNWTISQMERMAHTLGMDFRALILHAILQPEETVCLKKDVKNTGR